MWYDTTGYIHLTWVYPAATLRAAQMSLHGPIQGWAGSQEFCPSEENAMAAARGPRAKGRESEARQAVTVLCREIGAKKGELRRQRRTAPPVVRREIDLQLQLLDNIDSEVRLLGHAKTCILSLGPLDPGPR